MFQQHPSQKTTVHDGYGSWISGPIQPNPRSLSSLGLFSLETRLLGHANAARLGAKGGRRNIVLRSDIKVHTI
jgi:hypothetical protein